jgi:uncharacterized protein (DUF2235 family)
MKRLIVCCDGTWQKLTSEYPTNVAKITQAIKLIADDGIQQIVFYSEGVGTGDLVDKFGGGAFGWGLDNVIQNAYRFLCLNYDSGDQIYLFGFSRGAYIVRSLAGLIYNAGLLKRHHIRETPKAYELYRDRSKETKPSSKSAQDFRVKYSQQVDITFLGCWDTVGSLGIPDQIPFFPLDNWINQRYQFHDIQLNSRIQCARHAVAIDEKRKVFYVTPMQKSEQNPTQDLKQVWFSGEHGCVGGGTEEHRGLSDTALKWMIDEAKQKGLSFQEDHIQYGIQSDPLAKFDNTLTGIYVITGARVRRLSDDPIYNVTLGQDVDQAEYLYATIDDLHESLKKRWWSSPNLYRPEGLENFKDQLDKSSPRE